MSNSASETTDKAQQLLLQRFKETLSDVLAPLPDLTITQWADAYRFLPPKAAIAGKWQTANAPYAAGIMDAISNPYHREIVCMMPSQVCKTEVVLNTIGYYVHLNPTEMLVVQPKIDAAEKFSKERVEPLFLSTPVLRERYNPQDPMLQKTFPGGTLTLVGANSPTDLSSRAVKVLLFDEVDRYERSAGDEGDPIDMAIARTTSFWDYKVVMVSSPKVKQLSRIEPAYLASDMRKWFVPCPHCSEMQELVWGGKDTPYGLKWEEGKPDTAYYVCAHCACEIKHRDNRWMQERGEWVITNPGASTVGFWMSGLNSLMPGASWDNIVRKFLIANTAAKAGNIEPLKNFTQTVLAETWTEEAKKLDDNVIGERREVYDAPLPTGAKVVLGAVDVQKNRLEFAAWGFGKGEESWLVDHHVIPFDPLTDQAWIELEQVLLRTYTNAAGHTLNISGIAIDSGYHASKERVERFALSWKHVSPKIYVVKGEDTRYPGIIKRPTKSQNGEFKPYLVYGESAKDLIFERFKRDMKPGPGYIHLPSWLADELVAQFSAEAQVQTKRNGRVEFVYRRIGKRSNEQLDLLVYSMAVRRLLSPAQLALIDYDAAQAPQPVAVTSTPSLPDATPTPDVVPVPAVPAPTPVPVAQPVRKVNGIKIYSAGRGGIHRFR